MADYQRRRRRVRRSGEQAARPDDGPGAESGAQPPAGAGKGRSGERRRATTPVPEPPRQRAVPTPPAYPKRRHDTERRGGHPADDDGERGLRGLVGSGSSQVGVAAAMRARDAARPTPDDLAAAERDLTIVRRHWVPRDPA